MKNSLNSSIELEKECEPCEMRDYLDYTCSFLQYKKILLCPCKLCFFKFKCHNICPEYNEQFDVLRKEIGEENV
jgi:hypothetical protein